MKAPNYKIQGYPHQFLVNPLIEDAVKMQKGVNLPRYSSGWGVSIIGSHVQHQFLKHVCSPVVPLVTQAKMKLAELRRMPKPNLP